MLFSQRKYTIINQRTQTCNETYFLFEKNEKTLESKKKSLIRYPSFDTLESSVTLHSFDTAKAGVSLLSYTNISTLYRTQVSRFFLLPTFDTPQSSVFFPSTTTNFVVCSGIRTRQQMRNRTLCATNHRAIHHATESTA